MSTRAHLYCRISSDPQGLRAGVGRQEDDCRAYVEARGWAVAAVHVDNDTSAYSGKPRPAYEAMMAAVGAGEVDAIVAWHPDRLHRHPSELERFIEAVEAASVPVHTVTAGDFDLATPEGRLVARITGAVARKESEDKSRRGRRKALALAQEGAVAGGGSRPFGYEDDRLTVREDEAELIREAAEAVLAGRTLRAVVAEWNARGIPTVSGRPWRTVVLRRILTGGRWAGLREHGAKTSRPKFYPAQWPAILDRATHIALRSLLLDPKRRTNAGRPHTYLLTGGLARCGMPQCGAALVARPRDDGRPCYVCASDMGGCGKIRRLADPVDALVREWVAEEAAWLEYHGPGQDHGPTSAPEADPALLAELERLEARLDRARELLLDGTLSKAEYAEAKAATEAARDRVGATVAEALAAPSPWQQVVARRPTPGTPGTPAPTPEQEDEVWRAELDEAKERWLGVWDALAVDQRREVAREYARAVVVLPARRGYNRFDPSRIVIERSE